jgi:hypothetical protein
MEGKYYDVSDCSHSCNPWISTQTPTCTWCSALLCDIFQLNIFCKIISLYLQTWGLSMGHHLGWQLQCGLQTYCLMCYVLQTSLQPVKHLSSNILCFSQTQIAWDTVAPLSLNTLLSLLTLSVFAPFTSNTFDYCCGIKVHFLLLVLNISSKSQTFWVYAN